MDDAKNEKYYELFGNIIYRIKDDGITIHKFTEKIADKKYIVPKTIRDIPVVSLDSGCFFFQDRIEEIQLSETIKTIGPHAFALCRQLKRICLPESLKFIGDHAFRDTGIEELNIPGSVKELVDCTFSYAKELKRVYLNEGLEKIGRSVFYMTKVETIDIPNSVRIIRNSALEGVWNCNALGRDINEFWFKHSPCGETVIVDSKKIGIITKMREISCVKDIYSFEYPPSHSYLSWCYIITVQNGDKKQDMFYPAMYNEYSIEDETCQKLMLYEIKSIEEDCVEYKLNFKEEIKKIYNLWKNNLI